MEKPSRSNIDRSAKARYVFLWGLAIASSLLVFAWKTVRDQTAESESPNTKLRMLYHEYSYTQIHMAMPVRITVYSTDESAAKTAVRAAFQRVSELVNVFSDYEPNSEINRLLAANDLGDGTPQPVGNELLRVLIFAKELHTLSHGAFDPTASPSIQLWRTARKDGLLPNDESIASAQQLVGFDRVNVDAEHARITLPVNMSFDFGAIAKGHIADEAIRVIQAHGLNSACIEAGGDFVVSDRPPGQNGWEIDIPFQGPQSLSNCAVSVSGDTAQFVVLDGIRYSHVVDPRTGMALTNRQMSVIIASCGMHSDALATTGCILDRSTFNELIEHFPGVKAWQYSVTAENGESL